MAETLSQHQCPVILMYSKDNSPRTTATATEYNDIMQTLINFFEQRITYAEKQGINRSRLILDPGMGAFISSIPTYSYEIINRLSELKNHFNLPILIGTSRKSMHPFPLKDRLIPSIITATLAIQNGANIIRVHDVKEHKLAIETLGLSLETPNITNKFPI
jgi:dihydropteroate synthase